MTTIPPSSDPTYLRVLGNINPLGPKALAFALAQSKKATRNWHGECQEFTRMAYGAPGGENTAIDAWNAVPGAHKHGFYLPPAGVPVYWSGGTGGDGHAAIACGDAANNVWSVDIGGAGTVTKVPLTKIHATWGLTYLGWMEIENTVHCYTRGNAG